LANLKQRKYGTVNLPKFKANSNKILKYSKGLKSKKVDSLNIKKLMIFKKFSKKTTLFEVFPHLFQINSRQLSSK
jgi:hypothetical protein